MAFGVAQYNIAALFLMQPMSNQLEPDVLVKHYKLSEAAWEKAIRSMLGSNNVYAPLKSNGNIDYEPITTEKIPSIIYNEPKPVSPLKLFLLPVKENVVLEPDICKPIVIIGTPACDLWALDLLDKFYLNSDFIDPYYKLRREKIILIGTDCHSFLKNCHCTSYGINPIPEKNQDILLSIINDQVILEVHTKKGEKLLQDIAEVSQIQTPDNGLPDELVQKRREIKTQIDKANKKLPNYQETTSAVKNAIEEMWQKHSESCVSCGACATICPTCTCFLLIDKPGFEKVKQMDACQYPGFQRVAGGEDPLRKHSIRFCNRYFCKYVFRPEKFDAFACTGCGRCIEACIGKIDKNEIFIELTK